MARMQRILQRNPLAVKVAVLGAALLAGGVLLGRLTAPAGPAPAAAEAAPPDPADDYYAPQTAGGDPLFQQTTVQAFQDAGASVTAIQDLLAGGIYFTTAVKCGKVGYGLKAATIGACSHILEGELALFPNVQVYMLMGDVAIKAVNAIARRAGEPRVIPAGSTYKIRGRPFSWRGRRVFH